MKITFSLMLILILSIGIGNEGPMKVVEGKNCDVKLYNYCEENCFTDCPKKYQNRAIGFCNNDYRPPICMCRYRC
ncbi:hypothetical protein PHAVU_011G185600 [Phaseolus vulgaris]|uniref:Knottin scorpion toxin-like domain-containing protein n=1 Tax=Phaseolus vulgaris TaxID=3885 RepID=V7AJS0_PHAVU|nr:hypothetical protein PHAVU_011G185600g [Phaseolus vulgaris]ESW05510.1 hypothetical protein PHAVU_011G185600g [Phaseolus vulgaris]